MKTSYFVLFCASISFLHTAFAADVLLTKCVECPAVQTVEIPKINIDTCDSKALEHALKEWGAFELVGQSIDELADLAIAALTAGKHLLNLPTDQLQQFHFQDPATPMHGFHNVFADSLAPGKQIQNHIAYYLRPYFADRAPESVNINALKDYYKHGMQVLYRLYDQIARLVIDPKNRTNFDNDTWAGLTLRRYFDSTYGKEVFASHSDFAIMGLGTSDEPGLEIYHEGKWVQTPAGTKPRFFVTIGNWLRFQARNHELNKGVHRVMAVKKERHFLGLFLNPDPSQKLETVSGKIENFDSYWATFAYKSVV